MALQKVSGSSAVLLHPSRPASLSTQVPVEVVFLIPEECVCRVCVCPGGWSVWAQWAGCSSQCGGGIQTRSRSCRSPPEDSSLCEGVLEEGRPCNPQPCSGTLGTRLQVLVCLTEQCAVRERVMEAASSRLSQASSSYLRSTFRRKRLVQKDQERNRLSHFRNRACLEWRVQSGSSRSSSLC